MAEQSDEEVWRLPHTARGRDVRLIGSGGPHGPSSLSPAAKARLSRITSKVPEVMVKVTGRTRGAVNLKSSLDYVTRNGKLLAETQDGEIIESRVRLRGLHDDWLLTNAAEARGRNSLQAAQSVGIILSMPPGAPRDRVQDAARTWAKETFAGKHDWIMVRHDDKDHPHVHVVVRAVGNDGKRLAPGPADLQRWRERFADELRRLGVEAEATPRQARGIVKRSERPAVQRLLERDVPVRVKEFQRSDSERAARAPKPPQPRDWQQDIQARQSSIRRAYLLHADALAQGDADDQRLANDIRRFVADMPVPLTRRQALAVELRHVLEQRPERNGQLSQPPRMDSQDLHRANRQRDREVPERQPEHRSGRRR